MAASAAHPRRNQISEYPPPPPGAERLKMRISGKWAAKPRRCQTRWAAAVGGDERVEIKEILKMMVHGPRNGKIRQKNGDAPERIFW